MASTLRVCSVVGARPQFVKAAMVGRALADAGVEDVLVHTGQHYDANMDRIFFEELALREPAVNLGVGSASHARQTGDMMVGLERFLLENDGVDWVLAYGDTNSTLAAALVAAKLHLPLAHVEAGLRSFNRAMPEEVNRIVTDRLAQLCCCPTPTAVHNLKDEGITDGVFLTGDVMLDATRFYAERAEERVPLDSVTGHASGSYVLATVHRAENTDAPDRLARLFDGLGRLEEPVLMPLHPRTRERLDGIAVSSNVEFMEPVGYCTMLALVQQARCVLTDSGGLQKEAVWLGVPCITLRDETEWAETQRGGWNQVVGTDPQAIVEAVWRVPEGAAPTFGAGETGQPSKHVAHLLQTQARGH